MEKEFTVWTNDFHNSQKISEHRSLKAAIKTAHQNRCLTCTCGGPEIQKLGLAFPEPLTALDYYRYMGCTVKDSIDMASTGWTKFKNA